MPSPRSPRRPLTHALVVETALSILARVGLPDLTMRAIGTELGVQQSAIYHHVPNKQALLGAVADEILRRGPQHPSAPGADWRERAHRRCTDLHAAVTAYPDGADLVMSMWAFGMGGQAPAAEVGELLADAGLEEDLASTAASTLLHFVYGHAYVAQSHDQATRSGIAPPPRSPAEFGTGLGIVLTGIAALVEAP
ncbi:TetR/AcrR family transcriptional regulator C-terminal domain-containing protein [Janibacter terrae]|uniref:TetR/AcrR family transcriptional regulator C-terminal domain-containing protein n=1 Tax=Janibacter terrae TaxID=103817 RepID=UPI0031F82660